LSSAAARKRIRMVSQAKRSRYFQEIARGFLNRRGAPFVLSSRDIVTIAAWEEQGIPLQAALDGVERAFERYKKKQGGGRKMPSLSYCQVEVVRAFDEYRGRRVGRGRKEGLREEKRRKVKTEVERFLRAVPPEIADLRELFADALKLLSRRNAREEAIEKLEEKAGELLLRQVAPADRIEMGKRVRADFSGRPDSELERILEVYLDRFMREKYRVPHLSFFYY
jgi:hypothetical protein